MNNHIEEKVLLGFGDEPCGCNLEPASLRERSDGGYDVLCKNGYPIPQDDYLMPLLLSRSLALQGIPTESLPEVKKALLFALYRNHVATRYSESDGFDHYYLTIGGKEYLMFSPTVDGVVGALVAARKDGHDFKSKPDINALLDSVKEG